MKYIFLFIGNYIILILFGLDLMDYYFDSGVNIISLTEFDRLWICWTAFATSLLSVSHFWFQSLKKDDNNKTKPLSK